MSMLKSGWSQLKTRSQQLRSRLSDSQAGRVMRSASKQLGRGARIVKGNLTLGADHVERFLPGGMSSAVRQARAYNPLALGGYLTKKIKDDPAMLGCGVASSVYITLKETRMLQRGVNLAAVVAFDAATTALKVGAVLWREHHKGSDPTLKDTVTRLGREYRKYADKARLDNRRYMRRRASVLNNQH